MEIKAVLFDLDGTLLPMDLDAFLRAYFGLLIKTVAPRGYEPKKLEKAIMLGTQSMLENNGERTNEAAFWKTFTDIFGGAPESHASAFDSFYLEVFDKVRSSCAYTPAAKETVELLRAGGIRTILATNPVFPKIATEKRMAWAGLYPGDFEYYTTYENSSFCKPSLDYYREILARLSLNAEDCLMVGNDVDDDMVAEKLGMKVFLLTDNLINKSESDVTRFRKGGFDELLQFIKKEVI